MSLGRVAIAIALSADERLELERMVWGHKTWADLARRARIVLLSAVGLQNKAIAQRLGCAELTVSTWRKRFSVMRLDGLQDAARSGALRRIGDAAIAETVRLTLESLPAGSTHWSLRGMADKVGYAPSTIHRIWRAFGLQPHGAGTLKLSTDRLFVEKVRDIVGLYMSPPECAPVLSVDEKSQIQALDRTQPLLPMPPGQIERRSHDYTRHGTTSLSAAPDVATGQSIGKCYPRHRATEFRNFRDKIEANVPADLDIHIALAGPLHPDKCLMDQPDRTVRSLADPEPTAPQRPQINRRTRKGHTRLCRPRKPNPETLSMDQIRRRHPSIHQTLLHRNNDNGKDFGIRTLGV